MKNKLTNGGFIKMIIVIIIAIAILSYYGINLKDVWDFIVGIWNSFLVGPATYLWHLWVQYVWTPFMDSVNSVKN